MQLFQFCVCITCRCRTVVLWAAAMTAVSGSGTCTPTGPQVSRPSSESSDWQHRLSVFRFICMSRRPDCFLNWLVTLEDHHPVVWTIRLLRHPVCFLNRLNTWQDHHPVVCLLVPLPLKTSWLSSEPFVLSSESWPDACNRTYSAYSTHVSVFSVIHSNCVCVRSCVRACVCVCARARARARVCVCVCVWLSYLNIRTKGNNLTFTFIWMFQIFLRLRNRCNYYSCNTTKTQLVVSVRHQAICDTLTIPARVTGRRVLYTLCLTLSVYNVPLPSFERVQCSFA